jgi:hypothetical protein
MASDTVYTTLEGRVRAPKRQLSGTNAKGPWAMEIVEILDPDDNKLEIVLPKQGVPDLPVGTVARFPVEIGVRSGRLSIGARSVEIVPVDGKTGEIRRAS